MEQILDFVSTIEVFVSHIPRFTMLHGKYWKGERRSNKFHDPGKDLNVDVRETSDGHRWLNDGTDSATSCIARE